MYYLLLCIRIMYWITLAAWGMVCSEGFLCGIFYWIYIYKKKCILYEKLFFLISWLIRSVSDGVFRQYRGPRDKDHFLSFVEEKKWLQAEEVPAWKSPGSYQMAVVAQFFKVGMWEMNTQIPRLVEINKKKWKKIKCGGNYDYWK